MAVSAIQPLVAGQLPIALPSATFALPVLPLPISSLPSTFAISATESRVVQTNLPVLSTESAESIFTD